MKSLLFSIVFSLFFIYQSSAQKSALDTWTIGLGASNTIMHGDLTSLNSSNNSPLNMGFYLYVNKMVSPAFGFELKGQVLKLNSSSQDFSSSYDVLYTENTAGNLYSEGETFGGELNAVINLNGLVSNPYAKPNRKINFSAYLGLGFHTYNSKLFDLDTDELLLDFEAVEGRDGEASSIYYTAGLGLRYKLSQRFDIELRQAVNFNNEDHLDAAISQKQVFETFFTTNLGLVFKLNKKGTENVVWQDNIVEEDVVVEEVKEEIELIDTDGDGVIDQLDKEPDTPKGAATYGNGVAIDTDRDGVIDINDKCPLKFGSKELEGCPLIVEKDTDGDGVLDKNDLCPNTIGPIDNRGCPILKNTITEIEKTKIISLAKNIYFTSGQSVLRESSKRELDKIAKIMTNYENIEYVIEGHTDSGGKRDYNLKLSQNRADAVKNYLTFKGVDPSTLSAMGYGFSRPKYNNRTSGGRQLNRRVEIKINDDNASSYVEPVSSSEETYVIKKQDTLFSIAKRFNVSVDQLKEWNNLEDNNIIIGETLIIKK